MELEKRKTERNLNLLSFCHIDASNIILLLSLNGVLKNTFIHTKTYHVIKSKVLQICFKIKKARELLFFDTHMPHFVECQKMMSYMFENDVK